MFAKPGFSEPPSILYTISDGGPGDQIRMASLYPDLLERCSGLMATCDPRVQQLLERSFPDITFHDVKWSRREIPTRDFHLRDRVRSSRLAQVLDNKGVDFGHAADSVCMITETLHVLRPDRASFPRRPEGYLRADPHLAQAWAHRIGPQGGSERRARVAISWRSLLRSVARDAHYFDAADFLAFAEAFEDVEFWIFQPSMLPDELVVLQSGFRNVRIPEGLDLVDDFEAMSAFLVNMDFAISPFTTNGELSAALGVKTLLLSNSHLTTWRRNHDGSDAWHANAWTIVGSSVGDRASTIRSAIERLRYELEARSR